MKRARQILSYMLVAVMVILMLPTTALRPLAAESYSLSGKAHVQSYGDQNGKWDGKTLTLGTTGKGKRLESVTINFSNQTGYEGSIEYRVHRQTYGWTGWVKSGQPAGTTGQGKRLEGLQLRLTGELANHYSIRYRVHIQTYGWNQGWQYDGAIAGTTGESKRLEALEIQLVPKATENEGVAYRVHRQTFGWEKKWATNGAVSGTTGQSKRLEGITIALTGGQYSGGITYRTHVQSYGWMSWCSDGEMSGTSGKAKRLEAIEIKLTGDVANYYDVYYRVHAQSYGWLGWAKNGETSGTEGLAKRLEAIQIVLVKKGASAPGAIYAGVTQNSAKSCVNGNTIITNDGANDDNSTYEKTQLEINKIRYDDSRVVVHAVKGATGYEVYKKANNETVYKKLTSGEFDSYATNYAGTAIYDDKAVSAGAKYQYIARIYKIDDNGNKQYGPFTSPVTHVVAEKPNFSAYLSVYAGEYSRRCYIVITNKGKKDLILGGSSITAFATVTPYKGAGYTTGYYYSGSQRATSVVCAPGVKGSQEVLLETSRYFENTASVGFPFTYDGCSYLAAVYTDGLGVWK